MWPALLLSGVLAVGQTTPPAEPPAAAPPAPPPAADRWLLMQALQGTYPGWLLDGNKVQVSGWTETSFTASTDRFGQPPMGFNYRADEFLLHQHWLRVEKK